MTVAVSNTNLTDSFNSWRLNTNLAATVISNNAVTVFRAGSSARGKAVTGNTHVKGTVSAVELRTDTIRGGNAAMGTVGKSGAINIASNTSVTGTTLTVAANTTFTGNVIFNTAGTDRINLGNIDRVIVSGGAVGQFLRIASQADNPQFKALTLRDITDLSSNSAHLILSGANTTFSAGAKDSPHLIFAGGSNSGADRFHIFAGDNSTAGDDDLIIQLTDNVGDSTLKINNAANTNMATISSQGIITANSAVFAGELQSTTLDVNGAADISGTATLGAATVTGATTLNGDVTLGNASTDVITTKGTFANLAVSGISTFNGNVIIGNANTDTLTVTANTTFTSGVNISGGSAIAAPTGTFDTLVATVTANLNGAVNLGDASTDVITTKGKFANAEFSGPLALGTSSSLRYGSVGGTVIIGSNGKLHANNAITNSTIKGVMLENSGVTAGVYGSASAFPVVTVDAQGLVTTVTTSALNNATASVKGIASFSTDNFLVSSGVVTVKDNGIILGTETTGNYIATIAGTANQITVSGSGSETAGATLSLPSSVTISGTSTAATFVGALTGSTASFSGNVTHVDNAKSYWGTGNDLQIYHNGTHSYIDNTLDTSQLYLQANTFSVRSSSNAKKYITANTNVVTLYHNDSAKLATKTDGVLVTGELESTTLDVNGNADISGTLTVGNVTVTGTLAGAIEADTIIPAASAATTNYLAFFNTATGAQGIKTDTGLTYNATTNALTTGTFVGALSGNATTATNATSLQTARTIGGVSFNGTASINLPGVNTTGNQNTSGNATTATNLTGGDKTISGILTVGTGTYSTIVMVDSDNGNRNIHCNSDQIGFLNGAGQWSAYSTDAGLWTCVAGLSVTGNISASGAVSGTVFNGAWQYLPAGTVALFHQTTAPTGWTKRTDHNNKAFRVVSGSVTTGGTQSFTTAFASKGVAGSITSTTATGSVNGLNDNRSLTIAQMPSHTHPSNHYDTGSQTKNNAGAANGYRHTSSASTAGDLWSTAATGGDQAHNHSWSGTIAIDAHNHTFSGTTIDMAVQYVDIIMATKN